MACTTYNSYPIFEKNQVLTNTQLNQLVAYLEEQSRLTRTSLIGIGIVCGFDLDFVLEDDSELGKDTLYISKGAGITSEGFLINFCGCAITKYRDYTFNPLIDYDPFRDQADPEEPYLEFQELLSDDYEAEEEEDIKAIDATALADKVIILFIETYDKDLKSCLTKSCDEIGIERKFTLRKLMIDKDQVDLILSNTGNQDSKLFGERYKLPEVALKQPLYNPPVTNYDSFGNLCQKYANILFAPDDVNPVLNVLKAWKAAYAAFAPVLRDLFDENPFEDVEVLEQQWRDTFDGKAADETSDVTEFMGIQYYYDFVKDLLVAYKEFRETSFDLLTACCPDKDLFPKHLILGEIPTGCTPSEYRQQFLQTPAYMEQGYLLEKTRSLFSRAVMMVEGFNTERVNETASYDGLTVKVTPSCEKKTFLSPRAIPYYYNIKENGEYGTLEELWNYDITRKCAIGNGLMAYENNKTDAGVPENTISTPLLFERDAYNFFRIEGALGKACKDIIDNLDEKIREYNLDFDVIGVRINDATAPVVPESVKNQPVDYNCGFDDLHEEYITFRYRLVSFLKMGLSVWELYQRIVEEAKKAEGEEFEEPIPDEAKEIIEEVYNSLIDFICQTLPPCIEDFVANFEELKDAYANAIEYVVDQVLENVDMDDITQVAQEGEEVTGLNLGQDVIATASRLVYHILDTVFYAKLFRIYYSFRRREYYLSLMSNKHSLTFSEYLEKHPGLEHQAGVPKGGTFIIVYGNFLGLQQRILADFTLPYRCCEEKQRCIPICDDDEAKANIQVAPYARPDFGFTFKNTSIEINLTKNDYALYDLENEYCGDDGIAVQNIRVIEVTPIDTDAEAEILEDGRHVLFTPPEGFTGILKFDYVLEKISNGLTDKGVVTILVRNLCVKLVDFEFTVRGGDEVVANLSDHPGYKFKDPDYDENLIKVENNGEELLIEVLQDLYDPYSFKYVAEGEENDGCGTITLFPAVNSQPNVNDHNFTAVVGDPAGTEVGVVTASDPDGDPLTFRFTGGATDIFTIDANTGSVTIINPDSMQPVVYTLSVMVTDPHGLSDTAQVIITAVEDNKPPQIEDQTIDVEVNTPKGTVVTGMEASDPDGDPLTFVIASGNVGNAFSINAQTGEVVVSDPTNFPNMQQYKLGIKVSDPQGLSAQGTLIINIIRTNEPPSVRILEPKDGASFPGPFTVITDVADDKAVDFVQIFVDNKLMGTTTASQDYSFQVTGLGAGSHTLFARAFDNEGASANSQVIRFSIFIIGVSGGLTENVNMLTNDELKKVLDGRNVNTTSNDTKAVLVEKLNESIKDQPLTKTELGSLSDNTLKKLADATNTGTGGSRTELVDNLVIKQPLR